MNLPPLAAVAHERFGRRGWRWTCTGCGVTRLYFREEQALDSARAHYDEFPCPALEAWRIGDDTGAEPEYTEDDEV